MAVRNAEKLLERTKKTASKQQDRSKTKLDELHEQVENLKLSLVTAVDASIVKRVQLEEITTKHAIELGDSQAEVKSAAENLKEAKRTHNIRRIRAGDSAKELADNRDDWAEEVLRHLRERRQMSDLQIQATAEALAEASNKLLPPESDSDSNSDSLMASQNARWSKTKRAKKILKQKCSGLDVDVDVVIHDYLLSAGNCARVLPSSRANELRQEGSRAFSKALCKYFDQNRCLYLKQKLRLSNPQYELLRNVLTKNYDANTATYVPLVLEGVMVEALPSLHFLDKHTNELLAHLGLHEDKEGRFAGCSLTAKLASDIATHLEKGRLLCVDGKVYGEGGKPVVICWSFDACRVFRGMKTTSFGYKIVNLINAPDNSAVYFHEFALVEAGDDWASIKKYCAEMIKDFNDVLTKKVTLRVDVPTKNLKGVELPDLEFFMCLDLAAMNACLGQGGNNMPCPCPLCKVHKEDLGNPDGFVWTGCPGCDHCEGCDGTGPMTGCKGCERCAGCSGPPANAFLPRSVAEAKVLAHTVAGERCPGCGMDIVEKVTDPSKERPVSVDGCARAPAVPVWCGKGVTHSTLHFNQKPGQVPLFDLSLQRFSICTLHLHLRFVAMLWSYSVLRDDDLSKKVKGKGGKGADDGTLAAWIWAVLVSVGVHVKLPTSPAKDVNKYFHSISKHSFHGRDASQLMTVWRRILRMVYPEATCAKDSNTKSKYERFYKCWEFYEETLLPLVYLETEDREDKAVRVEKAGREFLGLWNTATDGGTKHVYPHMLICHLPRMIREFPVDPMYLELQSMESSHAIGKQLAFKTNKLAPKAEAERVVWVEKYARQEKYVNTYMEEHRVTVKGHYRNTGKRRVFQILKKKLLNQLLEHTYETENSLAIKHKRWMAARIKRHATLATWKTKMTAKDLPEFNIEVSASDEERAAPRSSETESHSASSSSVSRTDDEADEAEAAQRESLGVAKKK